MMLAIEPPPSAFPPTPPSTPECPARDQGYYRSRKWVVKDLSENSVRQSVAARKFEVGIQRGRVSRRIRGAESPLESDIQNGRALSEAKEQILTKGGFHSLGTDERVLEGKPHPQRESLMRDAKRRKNM